MSGRSVRERLSQENEAPPLRVGERAEEARRLRRHAAAARRGAQSLVRARAWCPGPGVRTVALIGLLLGGCGKGSATIRDNPTPPGVAGAADVDPARIDGPGLYQMMCAQCHGPDATGYNADNAPSLVNPTFLESATDDFIKRSVAAGRPGTSMAGYGKEVGGPLDAAAIDRIVAWIRAQGPRAKPLEPAGQGDPTRGAEVFARDCRMCHGDAETRGTSVHLANPQFLAAATDAFIRHATVHGRPGTPMEAFGGRLSQQEIDDVVAYVRDFGKPEAAGILPPPSGKEPIVINPKGKQPEFTLRDGRFVSIHEVSKALAAGRKMSIVDARQASDWMRAHITGAVSIPYHDLGRLAEVPQDVWVIAYCACPHHLSGIIVDELKKRGHTRALILDEGVLEWHRRGYPMTTAPGVGPPPEEDPIGLNHGPHAHRHDGHGH